MWMKSWCKSAPQTFIEVLICITCSTSTLQSCMAFWTLCVSTRIFRVFLITQLSLESRFWFFFLFFVKCCIKDVSNGVGLRRDSRDLRHHCLLFASFFCLIFKSFKLFISSVYFLFRGINLLRCLFRSQRFIHVYSLTKFFFELHAILPILLVLSIFCSIALHIKADRAPARCASVWDNEAYIIIIYLFLFPWAFILPNFSPILPLLICFTIRNLV